MRFTFDPRKRAANLRNHGLDLADAQVVLASGATVRLKTAASTTAKTGS